MEKKREPTTDPGAELITAMRDSAEDHESIARLAYLYWEARGCPIGSPEEDWYRAENELRQPMAAAAGA